MSRADLPAIFMHRISEASDIDFSEVSRFLELLDLISKYPLLYMISLMD